MALVALLLAAPVTPRRGRPPSPVRLAVVVNGERPETDVSVAQLRRIFLGEQRFWGDGTPVHGVLPPQERPELVERFLRQTLGLPPDEYWRHWRGNVFRGVNNRKPLSLATTPATLRAVFRSRIPIAVVPAADLPAGERGLKVLAVGGKRIDDPDYPLQVN
ncbi:MAG: hypothetical protein D6696_16740 [Acidobacteria bacterium]|nr:MAG: hypothetical protein D6696_16740 [Acidobacteriota bacterium]